MSEMKSIFRRFTSLLLTALMVIALLPQVALPAFAATSGNLSLSDPDIGLSFTGSADNAWTATNSSVAGSVVKGSGCGASDKDSTLTITNNKSDKATLKFDYTIALNSGTIQISGNSVSSNGSFSQEINAGDSVTVYLKSGSTNATTITLNNILLLTDAQVTTTFKAPQNGSYTVDGTNIESDTQKTQSSLTAYSVTAKPDDGYQFIGWYNETTGKYISTSATASLNIPSDSTVYARFAPKAAAIFETGGTPFADLNEAIDYAKKNNESKITLTASGTITGTYTIPSGITLLIPFDDAKTLYTTTPKALDSGSASNKKNEFKRLTLASGASITVQGAISVGGQYASAIGSTPGKMTGNYGQIQLEGGSSITVASGGNLYAWGFVSGAGTVTVKSGGTVYEWFQIGDFRGGTATSGMGNKVFPFNQYFVQNVESALTIEKGAKEIVYSGIYAMRSTYATSITLIGDDGMFKINSGSLTKTYDGERDRIIYDINGSAELNSLRLSLMGMSIDSSQYVLPITNNMDIVVESGGKLTINQDAAMLPGVALSIANGADVTVASGKKLYVYDSAEWDKYACNQKFYSVQYAPSKTYTRTDADLIDAKIDVNGTLTAIGEIYTTASGADIISSGGTGKYVQAAAPGKETVTHQYTQSGSNVTDHEIAITAAKLKNADSTYFETANAKVGETIPYANGKWGAPKTYTVTFDANGGTGTMAPQTLTIGEAGTLNANGFTKEGYTFSGWNTKADGTGTPYADGASVNLTGDTTLYAQWTVNTYTIKWVNDDGTVLKTEQVNYGTTPVYSNTGETPIKKGNAQYSYTFLGWDPAPTAVTKDATYTATYAQSTNQYTVTWVNYDGKVLQEGQKLPYGAMPEYKGATPTRSADKQYTYTFAGWDPAVDKVTGDVTYKATYTQTTIQYTITWKNDDGTVLKTEKLDYGTTPKYSGEIPAKQPTAQYEYTFTGWKAVSADGTKTDIVTVTGDATYMAQYSSSVRKYTITWVNKNGEKLETEQVEYGQTPSYNGTPSYNPGEHFTATFNGWTPEISIVTKDATYTADYDIVGEKHTVTFNANGGTGNMTTQEFEYGKDTALTANAFTRENYTFTGWNTVADGSGTAYTDSGAISTLTENITLYAQWKHNDGWFTDNGNKTYYKNGELQKTGWTEIDGKTYYLDPETGYAAINGIYWLPRQKGDSGDLVDAANGNEYTAQGYDKNCYFIFGDDGALRSDLNGLYYIKKDIKVSWRPTKYDPPKLIDDHYIFVQNGQIPRHPGLIKSGNDYYYFPTGYFERAISYVSNNSSYFVSRTNDPSIKPGKYAFDADGKMIIPTPSQKNGLFNEDGKLYYYKDGVKTHAGLIKVGNDYYYIKTGGEAATGNYYVSNTNNLLPVGWYVFGDDGKMQQNGLVDIDGTLYYYKDGKKFHAGLIEVNGAYYYIKSSGEAATGKYYVSNTNNLLPVGWYVFGDDGKMQQNGLVDIDGTLYYYKDGKKFHAGLVEVNGAYYYIKSSGEAATGNYYVSNTNSLLPVGWYVFGTDGKMIADSKTP